MLASCPICATSDKFPAVSADIDALKLIGGILNAKDLGVDKKKTYKKHHHHHEDPVTAAAHTIQKLFKGKQSPATSQVSAELSPYVASERYRSEESPKNGVVAAVAYPFKAAAGLFMPAPPTPQSDGDISPTFASRLPRPPIARNDHGLGSTWSGGL